MRLSFIIAVLSLAVGVEACQPARSETSVASQKFVVLSAPARAKKPNFESEIRPIFQARCQPCHFQGGQVYEKLPFDKAETITRLRTKLFTRIKDEKEQQKIREFLDQP